MLKGGALTYTVVVALIISVLCSSLILLAHYHRIEYQYWELQEQLSKDAYSGIEMALAKGVMKEEVQFSLHNRGDDIIEVNSYSWGLYEVVSSRASLGGNVSTVSAMLGVQSDAVGQAALYLPNQIKPLYLAGNTLIKGDCYLPQSGVKRANVKGKGFKGSTLIHGKYLRSKDRLPDIEVEGFKALERLYTNPVAHLDSIIDFTTFASDSLLRSFDKPSIGILGDGAIYLSNQLIDGRVVIMSESEIVVGAEAQLSEVILLAPQIRFQSGFSGSVQAFAGQLIDIEEAVSLEYPSVIGLLNMGVIHEYANIWMKPKSKLSGLLAVHPEHQTLKSADVLIMEQASVQGQIWVTGTVDVRGSIYGNLSCSKIKLRTEVTTYENHLLDATLNAQKLSEHFLNSPYLSKSEKWGVAKWVN